MDTLEEARRIDRGELCPACKRTGGITREQAIGIDLFVCGCGAKWFDCVTQPAQEAA